MGGLYIHGVLLFDIFLPQSWVLFGHRMQREESESENSSLVFLQCFPRVHVVVCFLVFNLRHARFGVCG